MNYFLDVKLCIAGSIALMFNVVDIDHVFRLIGTLIFIAYSVHRYYYWYKNRDKKKDE